MALCQCIIHLARDNTWGREKWKKWVLWIYNQSWSEHKCVMREGRGDESIFPVDWQITTLYKKNLFILKTLLLSCLTDIKNTFRQIDVILFAFVFELKFLKQACFLMPVSPLNTYFSCFFSLFTCTSSLCSLLNTCSSLSLPSHPSN